MFIGHFALGLAAKRAVPRVSLGLLFGAAQLADLLWPLFLAAGLEQVRIDPGNTAFTPLAFVSYPYSHSLALLVLWGVALAVLSRPFARGRHVFAVVVALVVSHWLLDFITHRPDLPLSPYSSERFGLGLWSSVGWTLAAEFGIFAVGVWLYTRATIARDRAGSAGFWALMIFLSVIMVANVYGPPPPNVSAVAWTVQAMWLIVIWGAWVDRHRYPR